MVHLLDHLVHRAVRDHHHPGRLVGHGEVRQKFSDELYLVVEILCTDGSAGVYQENKIRFNSCKE